MPGAGKRQCGQQPGRWPHLCSNKQAILQLFVLVSLQPTAEIKFKNLLHSTKSSIMESIMSLFKLEHKDSSYFIMRHPISHFRFYIVVPRQVQYIGSPIL